MNANKNASQLNFWYVPRRNENNNDYEGVAKMAISMIAEWCVIWIDHIYDIDDSDNDKNILMIV